MRERLTKISYQDMAILFVNIIVLSVSLFIVGVGALGGDWSDPNSFIKNNDLVFNAFSACGGFISWVATLIFIKTVVPDKPIFSTSQPSTNNEHRTRENYINRVSSSVDDFFRQSLHSEVYDVLGLPYKQEPKERPWDLHFMPENRLVPPQKTILELFDESGRSLLILGQPASGKTFTLYQLAKGLLSRAKQDGNAPFPIILNLSSWPSRTQNSMQEKKESPAKAEVTLSDWITQECYNQYKMPEELTRNWVQEHLFIYFLDGFDEVAHSQQKNCLQAINQFIAEHPAEIVISSRQEGFEYLLTELDTKKTITIQPLTLSQIKTFLAKFGAGTIGLRHVLERDWGKDKELKKLIESPLFLNLMVIAHKEPHFKLNESTFEENLRNLFATYINRMFNQRRLPENKGYSYEQSLHLMTNLAYKLYKANRSEFYITTIYEDYEGKFETVIKVCEILKKLIALILFGILGLTGLSVAWLSGKVVEGIIGMGIGILLVNLIGSDNKILLFPYLSFLPLFLGSVFVTFLAIWLVIWSIGWWSGNALFAMLFGWLIIWFVFMLILSEGKFDWKSSLLSLLIYSLIYFSMYTLYLLNAGLFLYLVAGISYWLTLWNKDLYGFYSRISPFGFLDFLDPFSDYLVTFLNRFRLFYYNILPYPLSNKKFIAFLDAMAERLLLRRVGDGWVFIHRYLLEYFAAQHPDFGKPTDQSELQAIKDERKKPSIKAILNKFNFSFPRQSKIFFVVYMLFLILVSVLIAIVFRNSSIF